MVPIYCVGGEIKLHFATRGGSRNYCFLTNNRADTFVVNKCSSEGRFKVFKGINYNLMKNVILNGLYPIKQNLFVQILQLRDSLFVYSSLYCVFRITKG